MNSSSIFFLFSKKIDEFRQCFMSKFQTQVFFCFLHPSPLCPGTCACSTDSFSPIISEISPNASGVILCPFMTQQSSSILIFGTLIVTHLFAIWSFRHLFCCITLARYSTQYQLPRVGLRRDPECGWCTISYLIVPKQRQQLLCICPSMRSKLSIPPPSLN